MLVESDIIDNFRQNDCSNLKEEQFKQDLGLWAVYENICKRSGCWTMHIFNTLQFYFCRAISLKRTQKGLLKSH